LRGEEQFNKERITMDEQPQAKSPPSDALLRLIFESATDFAIFTVDPNGVTTSWNIGAERLLGYKEEEIIGQLADIIFTPEDGLDAAARERETARAIGRAEDERWQVRKDGSRFFASGLMMPLEDPRQGFVKILRDRTEHHRFEERLRESESLFRLLATNIPQLVFRSRGTGERTWASPQWSVYTGFAFDDSVGFGWLDSIHPEDRQLTSEKWSEAQSTGEYAVEHRIRRSVDGEYRWHQTRAVPLQSETSEWVGTSTDIHALRQLQGEQQVLLAELQHRTRNLIGVVQAIARKTLRSANSLEAFSQQFQSRLAALSRVQRLLASMDHPSIELRELIELELTAHGTNVDADRISVEGPSVQLPVSAAQPLALAVHELATNAVKHGALSQPDARLSIHWSLTQGPGIRLRWEESGVPLREPPQRRGYGLELIERALPYQLGAQSKVEFGPQGVVCEIVVRGRHDERYQSLS
jgi:PAS domain S-box-containing protein